MEAAHETARVHYWSPRRHGVAAGSAGKQLEHFRRIERDGFINRFPGRM
jgi:hypothetical protein